MVMELFKETKLGDDIDMLVNVIDQLVDGNAEASVQVPDPSCHQKHWQEIDAGSLARIVELKYGDAERMDIPENLKTSF